MFKTLKFLSLTALTCLAISNCSAAKLEGEVKIKAHGKDITHTIEVYAKRAGLYAAPFLLNALVQEYVFKKSLGTRFEGSLPVFDRISKKTVSNALVTGLFAAYFWPKASNVR